MFSNTLLTVKANLAGRKARKSVHDINNRAISHHYTELMSILFWCDLIGLFIYLLLIGGLIILYECASVPYFSGIYI